MRFHLVIDTVIPDGSPLTEKQFDQIAMAANGVVMSLVGGASHLSYERVFESEAESINYVSIVLPREFKEVEKKKLVGDSLLDTMHQPPFGPRVG